MAASYDAKINVLLSGLRDLVILEDRLEKINGIIHTLNKTPIALNVGGKGKERDLSGQLSKEVNDYVRAWENGTKAIGKSINGVRQQTAAFNELLRETAMVQQDKNQENAVNSLASAWVDTTRAAAQYEKKLNDIQRKAQGLQPQDVRDFEVARRKGLIENRKRLEGKQKQQQKTRNKRRENLMLGAGFPLLFGGGPAQVAGGLLGAMSDEEGFGGQIFGSAMAQQLEDAQKRIAEIGNATKTLNMNTLRDSVFTVNEGLEYQVNLLIRAGQADEARKAIAKQVTLQTGLMPGTVDDITNNVNILNASWNEWVAAISGTLSIIGAPFVSALSVILQGVGKALTFVNFLVSGLGNGVARAIEWGVANWSELLTGMRTGKLLAEQITEEEAKRIDTLRALTDTQQRELGLAMQLSDIEEKRTLGRTVGEKLINLALDKQIKDQATVTKFEDRRKELLEQYAATYSVEGKKQLALSIAQLDGLKQQELKNNGITHSLQKQRMELDAISERYSRINQNIELVALQQKRKVLIAQATGLISEEEAKILELQNQQLTVADQLIAKQGQLQALKGKGTPEELTAVRKEIIELENKTIELDIQVKKDALDKIRRDLESATAAANQQLDIQVNTIQGQNTLYQSQLQLLQAQNSLSLQRIDQEEAFLRKTIETTDSVKVQEEAYRALFDVAKARYKIALHNAAIERAATLAEIKSRLQLLAIEVKRQQIKYEELRVLAVEAKARGIINESHINALNLQAGVVELQKNSYYSALQNAGIQQKIANTMYRQKVEAAGFAYNQEVAALRTERLASGMERAASASRSVQSSIAANDLTTKIYGGRTTTNTLPTGTAIPGSKVLPFARGGIVTKPTLAMVGEGGEPEYVVPQSKAAGFSANYLSGARGSSAIPSGGGGGGDTMPTINIQTGPVMQQGGQNYVSIQDFEQGLQAVAASLLGNNRSVGGRRYAGVR